MKEPLYKVLITQSLHVISMASYGPKTSLTAVKMSIWISMCFFSFIITFIYGININYWVPFGSFFNLTLVSVFWYFLLCSGHTAYWCGKFLRVDSNLMLMLPTTMTFWGNTSVMEGDSNDHSFAPMMCMCEFKKLGLQFDTQKQFKIRSYIIFGFHGLS